MIVSRQNCGRDGMYNTHLFLVVLFFYSKSVYMLPLRSAKAS